MSCSMEYSRREDFFNKGKCQNYFVLIIKNGQHLGVRGPEVNVILQKHEFCEISIKCEFKNKIKKPDLATKAMEFINLQ